MDKIDLRPFLRQKVQEWKRASHRNPHLKSIEEVGRELLGVYLSEHQRSDRLASKILHQLDNMGKRNRMEKYISQMSRERKEIYQPRWHPRRVQAHQYRRIISTTLLVCLVCLVYLVSLVD